MPVLPVRRLARGTSVGLGAAALVAASALVPLGTAAVAAEPGDQVTLMTFNDFHGAISSAGGLACTVESVRAENPNNALISAGDSVGGSAFESAVQNDEPTIDVLNALGVDATAIGNHEYDQGLEDLRERIEPRTDFPDLAANVYDETTGERVHEPYAIVEAGGVNVAVIGAVTTKTVGKVSPSAIEGLEFGDPVDGVNDAYEELEASGEEFDVVVASYHEGANANAESGQVPANTDPIFDKIVTETAPEVDAIFNGDSHMQYNYEAPVPGADGEDRPIIQAGTGGGLLGVVTLELGEDGDWDAAAAPELRSTALPEGEDCAISTEITANVTGIADQAIEDAAEAGAEPVGTIAEDITTSWGDFDASYVDGVRTENAEIADPSLGRGDNRYRHSAAGDMLADSMKWYLEDSGLDDGREVIGFMNPGGIRADLIHDWTAAAEDDGVVTYAEANNMVPFGNTLNSGDVTGTQFKQILEEQWQRTEDGGEITGGDETFLAFGVSENVEYVFDSTQERDQRIIDIRIDGEPIDPDATYTIVTASFLFEGGDNMWTLSEAQNVQDTGVLDRDAFVEFLSAEENQDLAPDYAQRQLELQILDGGEYDAEAGVDRDPVLRIGNVESQSLGAPEIETVLVDAGEHGTFEAPYAMVEDAGRLVADVTLTDWLCVPEGTVVPLTVTAIPETGTEIVIDIPSFTWTEGGAPAECGDGDDDTTTPPPGDGDDDDATTPPPGDGDGDATTPPPGDGDDSQGGGDQGDDNAQDDDSAVVTPVDDDASGDLTADDSRSDLARTGVSLGSMVAVIGVVSLVGAGALGLRHRMARP